MNLNCVTGRENLNIVHIIVILKINSNFPIFFLYCVSVFLLIFLSPQLGCFQYFAMNILKINISLFLSFFGGGAFGYSSVLLEQFWHCIMDFFSVPTHPSVMYNYVDTHYIHMRNLWPYVVNSQLNYYVCPGAWPGCQAEPSNLYHSTWHYCCLVRYFRMLDFVEIWSVYVHWVSAVCPALQTEWFSLRVVWCWGGQGSGHRTFWNLTWVTHLPWTLVSSLECSWNHPNITSSF